MGGKVHRLSFFILIFSFGFSQPCGRFLDAVAFPLELEQMAPMKEAVEDCRGSGIVPEQFSPVFDGAIGCQQSTFLCRVPVEYNIEQIVGSLLRPGPFSQEQVIDDQEICFGEDFVDLFASFKLRGLEEIFEEGVGLAVDDLVSGDDCGVGDSLCDVAFAGSRRSDK